MMAQMAAAGKLAAITQSFKGRFLLALVAAALATTALGYFYWSDSEPKADLSAWPHVVKIGDRCGYIDRTGKMIINPQFNGAEPFDDQGLAPVQQGERWGFIDRTGKMVINPQFDDISCYDI